MYEFLYILTQFYGNTRLKILLFILEITFATNPSIGNQSIEGLFANSKGNSNPKKISIKGELSTKLVGLVKYELKSYF